MNPVAMVLIAGSLPFVAWLLWDGWRTGEVWVKGGSHDRLTRGLGMHSFAHKVSRDERPFVYWLNMLLFAGVECLGLYLLITY